LADSELVGISQWRNRQLVTRIDFEQCHVGLVIATDDLGGVVVAVLQRDRHLVGILDHVIVGKDVTVFGNDKPGTQRFSALMAGGNRELSLTATLLGSLGRDVDHGGTEFGGEINKVGERLGLGHVAAFRGVGPELYFGGETGSSEKNQRRRHGHRRK